MSKTKFVNNELYDNLADSIDLSIDILKQIHSNYDKVKKLVEKIDSEKRLDKYIEYLEKKDEYLENNGLIADLEEICEDYEASNWMKPMLKKLESVTLDREEDDCATAFSRRRNDVKICLSFNDFSIDLKYYYDHDYHIEDSELDIDIEGMMEYFLIPNDKIKTFNKIMLEWIVRYATSEPRYRVEQLQYYINLYDKKDKK